MTSRNDPYQARARELATAAGLDPDGRIDRPGQRSMPMWCSFRDAARAEHNAAEAAALAVTGQNSNSAVLFLCSTAALLQPLDAGPDVYRFDGLVDHTDRLFSTAQQGCQAAGAAPAGAPAAFRQILHQPVGAIVPSTTAQPLGG